MTVDGQTISYTDWFPRDAAYLNYTDNDYLDLNSDAPPEGKEVEGYRIFYRTGQSRLPPEKLNGLKSNTLYPIMQDPLQLDAAMLVPKITQYLDSARIKGDLKDVDIDDPAIWDADTGAGIYPFANGTRPYLESTNGGIGPFNDDVTGKGYFYFPTRELAEQYMKTMLRNRMGIERAQYAAETFDEHPDNANFVQWLRNRPELPRMPEGQYELHKVYGLSAATGKDAGYVMNHMQIDSEPLVILPRGEAARALHPNP